MNRRKVKTRPPVARSTAGNNGSPTRTIPLPTQSSSGRTVRARKTRSSRLPNASATSRDLLIRRFVTCLSLAVLFFCMAGFGFLVGEPYSGKPLVQQALGRLPVLYAFADMSHTARFFGAGLTGLAMSVIVASMVALPYAFLWLGVFMDHAYVADAEATLRPLSWKLAFAWRMTACVMGMLILTPVGVFGLLAAAGFWHVHVALVLVLLVVVCGAISWVITSGGLLIRRFVWSKRR